MQKFRLSRMVNHVWTGALHGCSWLNVFSRLRLGESDRGARRTAIVPSYGLRRTANAHILVNFDDETEAKNLPFSRYLDWTS